MARKWLEERWEVLLPALDGLGKEQEEDIRELCEAEKEWWRQRPGIKEREREYADDRDAQSYPRGIAAAGGQLVGQSEIAGEGAYCAEVSEFFDGGVDQDNASRLWICGLWNFI